MPHGKSPGKLPEGNRLGPVLLRLLIQPDGARDHVVRKKRLDRTPRGWEQGCCGVNLRDLPAGGPGQQLLCQMTLDLALACCLLTV